MPRLLFYFDYCSWIDNRGDLVGDLQFELLELFVFVVLIGRANSLGCLRNGGVNRGVNSSWPFLLLWTRINDSLSYHVSMIVITAPNSLMV